MPGYEKILDGVWRPTIGNLNFLHVSHSNLVSNADSHVWSRKTYNNAISAPALPSLGKIGETSNR